MQNRGKKINRILFFYFSFFGISLFAVGQKSIRPVAFTSVKFTDIFWATLLKTHAHTTLTNCIAQLRDFPSRISNFEKAAGLKSGEFPGTFFDAPVVLHRWPNIS